MKHLEGDQLLTLYYGDAPGSYLQHLQECQQCRNEFGEIRQFLDEARELSQPDREENYGAEVWARLQPKLPLQRERVPWFSWKLAGPVFAALTFVAFFAGMFVQRHYIVPDVSEQARARVLLMAMSDHLERSRAVLAELVKAQPGSRQIAEEQAQARDLLAENRLLRENAKRIISPLGLSVLDRLERVLIDLSHDPENPARGELQDLQKRIRSEDLLLQMKIVGANVRHKGQQL